MGCVGAAVPNRPMFPWLWVLAAVPNRPLLQWLRVLAAVPNRPLIRCQRTQHREDKMTKHCAVPRTCQREIVGHDVYTV